ncbi:MAG: AAA family ATPase [Candidatus Micrarchaeota archaeon]|mgnify:CR=1 FL=1
MKNIMSTEKLIIITGTPATGKSTIAKVLTKRLGYELIDVKKITKDKEVDVLKLRRKLLQIIKEKNKNGKDIIIENHLLCEISLPANIVFVLRTEPGLLKRRMQKRGYSNQKIDDNLLCEMLDYCTQKALDNYKSKIYDIDTGKRNIESSIKFMLDIIKGKIKKSDKIDFTKQLKKYTKG